MPIEREEYERLKKKGKLRGSRAQPDLERDARASAALDNLLEDSAWRSYQKMLVARLGALNDGLTKTLRAMLMAKSADELWSLQASGREQSGAIAALQTAIALPKHIKERGEEAAQELAERHADDRAEKA